jgi:peptide/nickel transport system substrate-binding protein
MLGWTPGTYDGHNALFNLMIHAREGLGLEQLRRLLQPEGGGAVGEDRDRDRPGQALAMMKEAMKIHKEDFGHLPLHQQALAWGVRETVAEIVQRPYNDVDLRFVTMK